jgi:hypothetical protein
LGDRGTPRLTSEQVIRVLRLGLTGLIVSRCEAAGRQTRH